MGWNFIAERKKIEVVYVLKMLLSLQEYILLNRTQVVDVDSKGRPCKERLLSVLFDNVETKQKIYADFATCDFSSLESVKNQLKEDGLDNLSHQLESLVKR